MEKPLTAGDELFDLRLARSAPDLCPMLEAIYGARPDDPAFRDRLVKALALPQRLDAEAAERAIDRALAARDQLPRVMGISTSRCSSRCLENSSLASEARCTSSGPSARRSVRWCA